VAFDGRWYCTVQYCAVLYRIRKVYAWAWFTFVAKALFDLCNEADIA
jgi:hypothetical protein